MITHTTFKQIGITKAFGKTYHINGEKPQSRYLAALDALCHCVDFRCHPESCVAVESKKAEKHAWLTGGLNGEEMIKLTVKRALRLSETLS